MINSLYPFARKWSEKGSVYLISDPHFDDADCWLMDPDWPGPGEYIEKLNKTLTKNDTLICLGDCGDPSYFSKLRAGYKVLIKGNHDKGNANYQKRLVLKEKILDVTFNDYASLEKRFNNPTVEWCECIGFIYEQVGYFDEVYEGPLFISEKLLLSHEPIYLGDVCFNIHGHTHDDNYIENYNELDITANHVNYEPISLNVLIKDGILSRVCGQHRLTIDKASK